MIGNTGYSPLSLCKLKYYVTNILNGSPVSRLTREYLRYLCMVLTGFLLLSCDAFNSAPEVDLNDRLSDAEVRQLMPHRRDQNTYIFGFELRGSPLEDIRQYLPLLEYLRKNTPYHFEIQLSTDTESLNSELLHKQIDFVAIGGMNYVNMARQYQLIPLVRGVNIKGESQYRAVIVVDFNSPIKKISQLKGKRFAFGSQYSTQGYLIPRLMLLKHGIRLDDLEFYSFTGSHQACAEAVVSKLYDACGMQDTLAQSLAEQGLVRILASSDYYPSSGIAATADVPEKVREDVRRALIKFDPQGKDKKNLYHWNLTEMPRGFVKASADDYKKLEKIMGRLHLLEAGRIVASPEKTQ